MSYWHGSYGNSKTKGCTSDANKAKSNTRFKDDWICGLCQNVNWAINWKCGSCKIEKGKCRPTRWTAWKDGPPTRSKKEEGENATRKELADLKEAMRKLKEGLGQASEEDNEGPGRSPLNELNREVAVTYQKEKDLDAVPESMWEKF